MSYHEFKYMNPVERMYVYQNLVDKYLENKNKVMQTTQNTQKGNIGESSMITKRKLNEIIENMKELPIVRPEVIKRLENEQAAIDSRVRRFQRYARKLNQLSQSQTGNGTRIVAENLQPTKITKQFKKIKVNNAPKPANNSNNNNNNNNSSSSNNASNNELDILNNGVNYEGNGNNKNKSNRNSDSNNNNNRMVLNQSKIMEIILANKMRAGLKIKNNDNKPEEKKNNKPNNSNFSFKAGKLMYKSKPFSSTACNQAIKKEELLNICQKLKLECDKKETKKVLCAKIMKHFKGK